ncbi:unnamed protein product, partial [Pylaiella littoralis]
MLHSTTSVEAGGVLHTLSCSMAASDAFFVTCVSILSRTHRRVRLKITHPLDRQSKHDYRQLWYMTIKRTTWTVAVRDLRKFARLRVLIIRRRARHMRGHVRTG